MNTVSNSKKTAIGVTEYSPEEILGFLSRSGQINFDDVEKAMKNSKLEQILHEKHPYKIYQSKDGRWNTYIKDPKKRNGRKHIAKTSLESLKEYLYELYTGARKREWDDKVTLRMLYPKWFESKSKETDADTYPLRLKCTWKKFYENDPIVDVPLVDLDVVMLRDWANTMIGEYKLTRKKYYNMSVIFRQALEYAVDKGIVEENLYSRVKINRGRFVAEHKKRGRTEVFSKEDDEAFQKAAWDDFYNGRHTSQPLIPLAILFCFQTGLRVGEICSLRYSDISEDGEFIIVSSFLRQTTKEVVDHTKGAFGDREVELTDEAKKLIALATEKQKELGASTSGFIFSCQDKPLGYGTMRKINEKYCRRAGIEYKSHHKIRKTVASKMLDDGINPDYIRLFLGQEDILTTWGHYLYDRRTIDENRKMLNSALSEDVPDQE